MQDQSAIGVGIGITFGQTGALSFIAPSNPGYGFDPTRTASGIALTGGTGGPSGSGNTVATATSAGGPPDGTHQWRTAFAYVYDNGPKVYAEIYIEPGLTPDCSIVLGFGDPSVPVTTYLGATGNSIGVSSKGLKYPGAFGANVVFGPTDTVQLVLNRSTNNVWIGVNNIFNGDPVAGTNPDFTGVNPTLWALGASLECNGSGVEIRLRTETQIYSPPAGYAPVLPGRKLRWDTSTFSHQSASSGVFSNNNQTITITTSDLSFAAAVASMTPPQAGYVYAEMQVDATAANTGITGQENTDGASVDIFHQSENNANIGNYNRVFIGAFGTSYGGGTVTPNRSYRLMFLNNWNTNQMWLGVDGQWWDTATQSLVGTLAAAAPTTRTQTGKLRLFGTVDNIQPTTGPAVVALTIIGSRADMLYLPAGATPSDEAPP